MKRKKSIIGGEGNGGVILNESHLGRDSIVGVTIFLNYLAFKDMKIISKSKDDLDKSFQQKIIN